METLREKAYLKSPVWLQNILISLYGQRLNKTRYGGNYSAYLAEYLRTLEISENQLLELQNELFLNVLKEAVEYVPYYRELFKRAGLSLSDIKNVTDIHKIPILDKESIRNNPDQFINEKNLRSNLIKIHTTGTTGTPLSIYCDSGARQRNYAFYNRFLCQNNIDYTQKKATFGGRIVVPAYQKKPPFWRCSYFQKNLLFSSYHISDETIPSYIEKLASYKPVYIDSYPSSLYNIARYAASEGISLRGMTSAITTSAETLYHDQRQTVESVFDATITDQYGAAEMCVFIGQCPEGEYHIHSDYGVVEFLREDGSAAELGEEADIVCTGFINHVMPLIRYRIGDRGVLSGKKCKCGSAFPVIEKLLGRADDAIVTPDGSKVGRLSPVLKGFPVKEVQYIQNTSSEVDVLVVKDAQYKDNTEKTLINELRKRLGNEIKINIVYVDSIRRGKGGKLKSIISTLV